MMFLTFKSQENVTLITISYIEIQDTLCQVYFKKQVE